MKTFQQWLHEYTFAQPNQMGDIGYQIQNLNQTLRTKVAAGEISNEDIVKLKNRYTEIIRAAKPEEKNKNKEMILLIKDKLQKLAPVKSNIDTRVDLETLQNNTRNGSYRSNLATLSR